MNNNDNDIIFLINKNKIIDNYHNYKEIGNIYYPLKTNTNVVILNTLINNFNDEDGFLISNLDHFNKLKELGVSPSKMCFINVLSSDSIIKYLYDNGVRFFVFDNLNSLKIFASYADLSLCKISIRLNTMEVFNDTLMHLGATTKETIDMLNYINNKCKIGISFYLQTKIKDKTKSLDKMLNYINNKFSNYKLNFVSIAGIKQSNKLNHLLITKIKKSLNLDYIILEPGKYLVGDCVDMITKVIRKRAINNKNILIIKNGIYSGLLDVILYKEKFKLYLINNNKLIDFSYKKDDNHDLLVNVCGGSSDSGDVIGSMYINSNYYKDIKIGSKILIKDIGSYVEEFFMSYAGDINKVYEEVIENEI